MRLSKELTEARAEVERTAIAFGKETERKDVVAYLRKQVNTLRLMRSEDCRHGALAIETVMLVIEGGGHLK